MNKLLLLACMWLPVCAHAQTRDPYLWPFSSTSIWNMPIHVNAIYAPANLTGTPTDPNDNIATLWCPMPKMDYEHIVIAPTAPLCTVGHSTVGWTGGDRCVPTDATIIDVVPLPTDYLVPSDNANSCATFIAPDGVTVLQNQPFARCTAGGNATTLLKFPTVGIYSGGSSGNHGGSGLSGFGGSIRLGELRPGQQGPRHALKVIVYAKQYLYPGVSIPDNY
jgi:hypothetical protein